MKRIQINLTYKLGDTMMDMAGESLNRDLWEKLIDLLSVRSFDSLNFKMLFVFKK